jgi:hypothetical protein
MYVALRTNEIGVVVHTAGLFLDETDAKNYVINEFGGQGYAAPFELVFRSPRPPDPPLRPVPLPGSP